MLLLSVTAVVLWPRTYGAEASLALDQGAQIENPIALAGRIEAALLERDVLASAAMDLPPELRSPDPIGRLRAGIRVQARGALGYTVEFRGSDPESVQRIANRLVDRAVALVPKLATSPDDAAPMIELSAKTRAVTDFLSAHPEATIEQPGDKPGRAASDDRALELLRTEKRQLEQRLATGATDNPYAEPGDDPALLGRRLAELKTTITRREAALKQPKPAAPAGVSAELAAQWHTLLAQLAAAQAKAALPTNKPLVAARVTARATLPKSPLTPNRLVLSIVAALLSLAAAMVAFVLPRKAAVPRRPQPREAQPAKPNAAPAGGSEPPKATSDAPPPAALVRSEPPLHRTEFLPPGRPASDPPGPIGPMRPVVVSSIAGSTPEVHVEAKPRRRTSPGGMEAPSDEQVRAHAATVVAPTQHTQAPVAGSLFGSRPPPGAGSYSVSSSHPPPSEGVGAAARTSVERLSPLQSRSLGHGSPSQPAVAQRHSMNPPGAPAGPGEVSESPRIMSRPPALDPEAERWAARFETPPPAAPEAQPVDEAAPKRGNAGRWKTQVMGSMVPLEVQAAREERRPLSEPPSPPVYQAQVVPPVQQAPSPAASTLVHHDVPAGWRPNVDPNHPHIVVIRDAILKQGLSRHLRVAVTNTRGASGRAPVACALALSLAQAGARVLLVEADFDDPQVHKAMDVNAPAGAGFSQQITARRHDHQARPWVVLRCSPTLQVLAEGRLRSPGSVGSDDFERAMRELGEQHHVLVISAPSLDKPTDLQVIDSLTQAAVLVGGVAPTIQFGNNPLRALF